MDGEGGRMRVKRETPAGSQTATRMGEVYDIRGGWLTGRMMEVGRRGRGMVAMDEVCKRRR